MFSPTSNLESTDLSKNYYVGRVVDNNDPLQAQRVRVVIPTVLEGEIETLPWVGPVQKSPFGVGPSFGTVNVPMLNSMLIVEFQEGDLNYGLYHGSVVSKANITNTPAQLKTNYPNRYGFFDGAGNVFSVDNGTSEVEFAHVSGANIKILQNGNVNVSTPANVNVTAGQNVNVTANSQVNVNAPTINLNGGSTINIEAPTINSKSANWNHQGRLNITGSLGMVAGGGLDGFARFSNNVIIDGNAIIGGISFLGHRHPETNSSTTGTPIN